jgi:predicted GIY-YIG superfamily endonuclease
MLTGNGYAPNPVGRLMEINMTYIYKMENKLNGKIYIGKAVNFKERRATHFREYRNLDNNKSLYKAMRN